jgi:hypothetical protein
MPRLGATMRTPSLPQVILALLSCTAAQATETDAVSYSPRIHPHGLYADRPAVNPDEVRTRDNGGLDVLTNLTGVTGMRADAVKATASTSSYEFLNLRVASNQTTYDDFLVGYYSFDLATQRLVPQRYEKAPALGIFEPENYFLLKDNTDAVNFYTNPATPAQFAQGIQHTLQSNTDYFANLTAGQRLCLSITNLPAGQVMRVILSLQDGTIYADDQITSPGTSVVGTFSKLPILVSGTYRLRIESVSPTAAFSYRARFFNENGAATTNVVNGSNLGVSLAGAAGGFGLLYQKYRVSLNNGQTVSVPADADTASYLINSRGKLLDGGTNSGIQKTVTETGTYYIIVAPLSENTLTNESYTGTLTITSALSFRNWSAAHDLSYGKDGSEQDADGDGVKNIVEYALGMNPKASDPAPPTALTRNGNAVALSYLKPDYVQGATVQPRFSTNGQSWSNGTATAGAVEAGGTRMSASFPAGSGRGFGRLEVSGGN